MSCRVPWCRRWQTISCAINTFTARLMRSVRPRPAAIRLRAFSIMSFGLAPYLGQDFFPTVDGGQMKLHIRAPTGTRIEETTSLTDRIGTAIHGIVPSNELDGIVSNIGLSVSGINMAYNNSGTIGVGDADILISLKPNHAPTDDYI